MAYGDRGSPRGPEWRGDRSFGGGWGNQLPFGDRDWDRGGEDRNAPLFGSGARDFALTRHDPHYFHWRDRQVDALDRDYDEYRRENQARFDLEFGEWRVRRGAQRKAIERVAAHMEVVGSDDVHVGTVDCTSGESIVLTRSDSAAGGVHHYIPCGWIERVDDKVALNLAAAEAQARWESEGRSRALFEREHRGRGGPHVLNRSFAGTYPDED